MRRMLLFLSLAAAAFPILGAEGFHELRAVPGAPATLADIAAAFRSAPRPAIANPQGGYGFDYQLIYPVVINTPGKNGTFYKTDYFVVNERNIDQEILIGFLEEGVAGSGLGASRFSLKANTAYAIPDFLGASGINKSGVGSLLLTTVLPGVNVPDVNGLVFGGTIVYTNQPGMTGTTSFYSYAVSPSTIHGLTPAFTPGARQNNDYRANFGVVNLDPINPQTFSVDVVGAGSPGHTTVTVPPLSMQYQPIPSVTPSASGYVFLNFAPSGSADFPWLPFSTTANNVTGDAWISLGVQFNF